ncbi:Fic family protein [Pontibacter sp. G13]|uniref:Fic family protein n=1 Tax=Pontibacter sp. G13 TaxID=3074898 RepID=UPI00288A5B42|nr:Fic family protein [Pontibacter sp. G13]WNJ20007.1 Fic family protein [Pontibacter sp. G13]
MKPPYEITSSILQLVSEISEKIGAIHATMMDRPSPELRKKNRVRTIKASLAIEGNTLSEAQITAIIDNKRVLGPQTEITEVRNAIEVYDQLPEFDPYSLADFLQAHGTLMNGLMDRPGTFRTSGVGIVKGNVISHLAPPARLVPSLMEKLFDYLKHSTDHALIKSCVGHYEIEFIHPFLDGNGRMGRLWHTCLMMRNYPIIEFLPFETLIKHRQAGYYNAMEHADNSGKSTVFIEFMLMAIRDALDEVMLTPPPSLKPKDRLVYFRSHFDGNTFSRKDYLSVFGNLSTATASRDLKLAESQGLVTKTGQRNQTRYSWTS